MENENNEYEYFDVNDCNGYGCYVDIESKYMLSDENDIIYLQMNEKKLELKQTESLYPATIQNIIYKTQKRPEVYQEEDIPVQNNIHINHIIWSMVIVYICLHL
jgi:hypothetical protein